MIIKLSQEEILDILKNHLKSKGYKYKGARFEVQTTRRESYVAYEASVEKKED